MFLHREEFAVQSLYAEALTQRSLYTEQLLHDDADADADADDDDDEDDDEDEVETIDVGSSSLGKALRRKFRQKTEVVTKLSLLLAHPQTLSHSLVPSCSAKPHTVSYVFFGFLRAHIDQVPWHSLSTSSPAQLFKYHGQTAMDTLEQTSMVGKLQNFKKNNAQLLL